MQTKRLLFILRPRIFVCWFISSRCRIYKIGEYLAKFISLIQLIVNQLSVLCFAILRFLDLAKPVHFRNCRTVLGREFYLVFELIAGGDDALGVSLLVLHH